MIKRFYRWIPCLVFFASYAAALENQATVRIEVVDEAGQPVPEAIVMLFFQDTRSDRDRQLELKANEQGRIEAKGWSKGESLDAILVISKTPGYHPSRQKQSADLDIRDFRFRLPIRKKENPIPMHVKRLEIELPEQRVEIGFDFEKADWVQPYGKGEVVDCTFIGTKIFEDRDNNTTSVIMAFPGESSGLLLDPAAKVESLQCSDFKSTRIAPEEGYEATREFVAKESTEGGYEGTTPNANYIFRSRTVLDEAGKIKSCHYGKLIKAVDVSFGSGIAEGNPSVGFTYYFNPTPNDRNLEFDPQQNLFRNLGPGEKVWDP